MIKLHITVVPAVYIKTNSSSHEHRIYNKEVTI